MGFFKQIAAIAPGLDVSIQMKEKSGKITVSVLPQGGSKTSNIQPLIVTGTPDELDEGFFEVATPGLEKFYGLKSNLEAFEKELRDKEKTAKEKGNSKTEAKSSVPKPRPGDKNKYASNKEAPAKKDKGSGKKKPPAPAPPVPDIFAQSPVDPDEGKTDQEIDAELSEESKEQTNS